MTSVAVAVGGPSISVGFGTAVGAGGRVAGGGTGVAGAEQAARSRKSMTKTDSCKRIKQVECVVHLYRCITHYDTQFRITSSLDGNGQTVNGNILLTR